jgi:hypothetical protein
MTELEFNQPLNGAQIARELDISRQAVSYTIRKSMGKMYHFVLDDGIADSPFTAILALMVCLGVNNSDISDVRVFLKMFDKDIIKEVTEEAELTYNIRK